MVPFDGVPFVEKTPLERNLLLRAQIAPRLASADPAALHELSVWIICRWGGIKHAPPFGWSEALVGFAPEKISQFILDQGKDRIPSWSKVLAFANSDHYAIYDTRVAITLNIALRAIGETRQFFVTDGRNRMVVRAAAALGETKRPMGYLDYLALLRALVSERGQTFLAAETTFFAAAPTLAGRLMVKMDEHLPEACSASC